MLVAQRFTSGAAPGMLLEQAASRRTPIEVTATKLFISHPPNRQAADGLTGNSRQGRLDVRMSGGELVSRILLEGAAQQEEGKL
jgi:hypothetical protein